MLEDTMLSKDGWGDPAQLGGEVAVIAFADPSLARRPECTMTGSRCATAAVRRLRRGSTRTSYPKCNFTPVNCGSAWIVRCCGSAARRTLWTNASDNSFGWDASVNTAPSVSAGGLFVWQRLQARSHSQSSIRYSSRSFSFVNLTLARTLPSIIHQNV